ncbi:unnamed protein product [Phytophthora lilii]|uniref:Unnamed protein product n=1 Tax=Phytophthora lilii TaxID=2077276 RepID=A0A9W6X3G2_9STRA|nr:unnamed protein product [Phytophthora lilii]
MTTHDKQDDNKVAVTATSSGLWSGCDGDDAGGRAGQRARLDNDDSAGNGAGKSVKHAWSTGPTAASTAVSDTGDALDGTALAGLMHQVLAAMQQIGARVDRIELAQRTPGGPAPPPAASTSLPPASPVAARPTRPGARAQRGATRAASGSGSSDTGGDDSEDGGLDPSQSGGSHASISDDDSSSSDDSSYRPGDDAGDHGFPSDDDRGSSSSDIDPCERSARSRRTAAARRRGRTRSRAPRRGSDEDSDGPDESRRSWKRSIKELMPFKPSPTMSVSTWIAKVDLR